MSVERANADYVQASLELEIAKLAVREFEDGTKRETIEDFEGRILLARSDLNRTSDRVAWSHRMKKRGTCHRRWSQPRDSRQSQMMLSLTQQESAFDLFKKYTAEIKGGSRDGGRNDA